MAAAKPHAVLVPYPAQGHVNPLLTLAKLLHHRGFHITFVNTDFNHRRLIRSLGASAVAGAPGFQFATIPDGLPPSDADSTQDIPAVCASMPKNSLEPFCELLTKLNSGATPPVSCIVADAVMTFTLEAADRFRLPEVLVWTASAVGMLGYSQYKNLVERGYIPLKDEKQLTNGYLETPVDWVPGLKQVRLRDIPSFIQSTNPNDFMINFFIEFFNNAWRAKAIMINTFDDLERDALNALSAMLPPIYTIGPLHLTENHVRNECLDPINLSLWKVDSSCLTWLDAKAPRSVVFVNFGCITVMTTKQLIEFAWGLANTKKPFLWIIRPDVVVGGSAILPPEILEETKERSMIISWCPQEQVLKHPAIGGFLTHCGWNSTIESIASGVPIICWPFFAEQQMNCHYSCTEWGIGMEIDSNVQRDAVESLVNELMMGEKGKKMKARTMEWKMKTEEVTTPGGLSHFNLDEVINNVLLQ